jgi:pimeloyl-ACP methyl ester carboxylesterase
LSERFDVVAYDSIGMGDSPMHPNFDPGMRGRELLAVARDAGFLDSEQPTFIVSHSQGGHSAMSAIEALPDAFAGLVLCDMMMMRPRVAAAYMAERQGGLRGEVEAGRGPRMSASSARPHRVRSDLTSILERYQLAPPQPCAVPFLLEYVARHSVRQVADGFVWKFDPRVRVTDGHPSQWWAEQPQRFAGLELPRAIVHGERSAVFPEGSADWLRELTGGTVPVIAIPEAHHHLMLDQPLAFVSVVSALLEGFLAGRC